MEQTPTIALEPFADRVFLQRDETADKTAGGVVIPENDKEKPNKGIVVSIGPECKWAYVGQRVIFGKDYGFELQISGQEVTVLREGDIYAGEPKPQVDFLDHARKIDANDVDGSAIHKFGKSETGIEINERNVQFSTDNPYVPGQFDNATRQQKAKQ